MFFLALNVRRNGRDVRLADRKRAVPTLPIELCELRTLFFHPNGTVAFDITDQLANVDSSHRYKKMDMIRDAARDDHPAAVVRDDPANVAVEPRLNVGRDQWNAVLCREHNVDDYLDQ
jgi:hypothetical protein